MAAKLDTIHITPYGQCQAAQFQVKFGTNDVARIQMSHNPLYSQDIALSDLFLFGWLKGELVRRSLIEIGDIFQAINEISGNLTIDIVRSVFRTVSND
jgi:hypothetical protein